jgi:hypothetical protein
MFCCCGGGGSGSRGNLKRSIEIAGCVLHSQFHAEETFVLYTAEGIRKGKE